MPKALRRKSLVILLISCLILLIVCSTSTATSVVSNDDISYDQSTNSYIIKEPAFRDIITGWKIAEDAAEKYRNGMLEVADEHEDFVIDMQGELNTLKDAQTKERDARQKELDTMTKKANRRWGFGAFIGIGAGAAGSSGDLVVGVGLYYRFF